jgi:hypothetical protein
MTTMAKPILTFRYNRKRMFFTAAIGVVVALGFVVSAFVQQHWSGWLIALPVAAIAVYLVRVTQDRRTILSIGPDGLLYAPFSARIVPWPEIVTVAIVRGERSGSRMDQLAFSLRSYEKYSGALRDVLRTFNAFGGKPGVACYVWLLDGAAVDDIARAIQAHWSGTIQEMRLTGAAYESTPWTGKRN